MTPDPSDATHWLAPVEDLRGLNGRPPTASRRRGGIASLPSPLGASWPCGHGADRAADAERPYRRRRVLAASASARCWLHPPSGPPSPTGSVSAGSVSGSPRRRPPPGRAVIPSDGDAERVRWRRPGGRRLRAARARRPRGRRSPSGRARPQPGVDELDRRPRRHRAARPVGGRASTGWPPRRPHGVRFTTRRRELRALVRRTARGRPHAPTTTAGRGPSRPGSPGTP